MGNQLFQAARKAVEKAGEVLSGKMNDDHNKHDHNHQQNQYSGHDDSQHQYSSKHQGHNGAQQSHQGADADAKAKAEGALMSAFANASPEEQKQLSELQDELKNM
ncbi:DUF3813 family protein [Metabacillus idriensis]|uniref:DUF3813 family protein n=1 Tax=Metabacillus idriensis TaxID=324768 RepID=A0A6I2M765_9BACI|nr:DUF3813 family protein [Metabacillus idriensis]MCM3595267.1 DUF3813 family protein [Metabacillus idriensis]MRX52706.1 DUF3813 family protein [Metabacillus idriensis]OHR72570.1 hypothetical protein HMPREF3291_21875 [Bacillus sp. HMSC76G11]